MLTLDPVTFPKEHQCFHLLQHLGACLHCGLCLPEAVVWISSELLVLLFLESWVQPRACANQNTVSSPSGFPPFKIPIPPFSYTHLGDLSVQGPLPVISSKAEISRHFFHPCSVAIGDALTLRGSHCLDLWSLPTFSHGAFGAASVLHLSSTAGDLGIPYVMLWFFHLRSRTLEFFDQHSPANCVHFPQCLLCLQRS